MIFFHQERSVVLTCAATVDNSIIHHKYGNIIKGTICNADTQCLK